MTNEQKTQLAELIIDFFSKFKPEEQIEVPRMAGVLKKPQGINGFKRAAPGTPVFEYKDRYLIYFESLSGDKTLEVPYYRQSLEAMIDFSKNAL